MASALSPVNLFENGVRKEFISKTNKLTDIYGLVLVFNQVGKDGTALAIFQDIHMSLKKKVHIK